MSALQKSLQRRARAVGLGYNEIGRRAGVGLSAVANIMSGRSRSPRHVTLEKIARVLNCTVYELVTDIDADTTAPLIGTAGAGEEIVLFGPDASRERLDAPPNLTAPSAVVVRGDSMLPAYRDGDVLFFERRIGAPAVPAEAMRHDCVVELMDGRMMIKTVLPAERGRVHLASYNRPDVLNDVQLRWAAPVRWIHRA